jgi:hypothetical protein
VVKVVSLPVYLYNHCSLSPLHCEFEPLFVNNKIGCTRLVTVHDKVCQLPAQSRRFPPGTLASSATI